MGYVLEVVASTINDDAGGIFAAMIGRVRG